jgi:hypothetical protein
VSNPKATVRLDGLRKSKKKLPDLIRNYVPLQIQTHFELLALCCMLLCAEMSYSAWRVPSPNAELNMPLASTLQPLKLTAFLAMLRPSVNTEQATNL